MNKNAPNLTNLQLFASQTTSTRTACIQSPAVRHPLALAISTALALGGQHAYAMTNPIIVDTTDTTITENGNCTLPEAIQAANTNTVVDNCIAGEDTLDGGDAIVLPDAALISLTESVDSTDGNNGLPSINSKIAIIGNEAIIERSANATGDFRIFHVAESGDLTLDNLTIQGGIASSSGTGSDGGCLLNLGTISISAIEATDCEADGDGGVIHNSGMLTATEEEAIDLSAIQFPAAKPEKMRVNFDKINMPSVEKGKKSKGKKSKLRRGKAKNKGGGIYNNGGNVNICDGEISENEAFSGGGIFNDSNGSVTFKNVEMNNNSASDVGGDITSDSGSVTVKQSTISGSSAVSGGSTYLRDALISFINSTITGVNGSLGGVFFGINGSVDIKHSTISGNTASNGSFIYGFNTAVSLINSIIANGVGNKGGGAVCDNSGGSITNENTLVEGGGCNATLTDSPLLEPLADNGGDTLTFALQEGSPAINPGVGCDALEIPPVDQRGNARDDDCDLGAFEFGATPPTFTLTTEITTDSTGTGQITSSPTGIDCPGVCALEFDEETEVTLTATPESGSSFEAWGGACSSSEETTVTVTMTADLSCTATFVEVEVPTQPGDVAFESINFASNSFENLTANPAGSIFSFNVDESAGEGTINVIRSNGVDGEISVELAIFASTLPSQKTTSQDDDLMLSETTLTWADQESGEKSVVLSVIDDLAEEDSLENFFIQLQNPTGGVTVSTPSALEVIIQDNDCSAEKLGVAFDPQSSSATTQTCFSNLLDGEETAVPFTVNDTDSHRSVIRIDVDPADRGKAADIVLLASFIPPGFAEPLFLERVGGIWMLLDEITIPSSDESLSALPDNVELVVHDGPLPGLLGSFLFFGGYVLQDDGTLVFNGNSAMSLIVE